MLSAALAAGLADDLEKVKIQENRFRTLSASNLVFVVTSSVRSCSGLNCRICVLPDILIRDQLRIRKMMVELDAFLNWNAVIGWSSEVQLSFSLLAACSAVRGVAKLSATVWMAKPHWIIFAVSPTKKISVITISVPLSNCLRDVIQRRGNLVTNATSNILLISQLNHH